MGIANHSVQWRRPLAVLPDWLTCSLDGDRVLDALSRRLPECRAGGTRLVACHVRRLVLEGDSGTWVGTFRVQVEAGDGAVRTVQLLGSVSPPGRDDPAGIDAQGASRGFAGAGWQAWLPELRLLLQTWPREPALPAVSTLTDPVQALPVLEHALRHGSPGREGLRIRSCAPRVLADKPGNRCVIMFDLEVEGASDRGRLDQLVGKVYRSNKGRDAFDGMRRLWRSPLTSEGAVQVAEPLAYLPDMKLLLQSVVPGEETLEDLLGTALADGSWPSREAADWLRRTARALASLHQCGVDPPRTQTLDDQVRSARALMRRLTDAVAPLTPCAGLEALLSRVEALAVEQAPDPLVPAHGGFAPEQVLLGSEGVGFVDFDDFSLAEPGLDVGLFLASLADLALSAAGAELPTGSAGRSGALDRAAELGELFLLEYQRMRPVTGARVQLWQTVDLLVHAARTWTKVKPAGPAKDLMILEHHLAGIGW